jgi:hypothetical protein
MHCDSFSIYFHQGSLSLDFFSDFEFRIYDLADASHIVSIEMDW